MKRSLAAITIICMIGLLFMVGCDQSENPTISEVPDSVKCTNGNMIGKVENDIFSHKGIPYAKAPVGELRWKAPEKPEPGDEDFDASEYGYTAIQTEWFSEEASYREQSEDCLTLNVWTSSPNEETKKPVMLFFHGGAYAWGGSGDPLYDGQNFIEAHDDIVFVTANYRLGMMGFVDFSSVEGGEAFADAPNLGLLDHIKALEWVNENIAAFGGDPDNVTIFGESAGGGTTSLLMIVDEADGLFKRCISQSGSVALTSSKEDCRFQTELIMEISGAKSMADLMAMSEEEIKELNATEIDDEGTTLNDLFNMPQRDGRLLPDTVEGVYEAFSNRDTDVDYMTGTNKNEWNYWIGEMVTGDPETDYEVFTEWMKERFDGDVANMDAEDQALIDEFIALQTDKESPWDIVEFYNDIAFRVPACIEAANYAAAGGNVYMYYWEYPSAINRYGACHAVELSYIFNNLENTIFTGDNPNRELAVKAQEAWVNFAKTGNPSIDGMEWPKYDSKTRATMSIDKEWSVVNDPLKSQRELVEKLIKYDIK